MNFEEKFKEETRITLKDRVTEATQKLKKSAIPLVLGSTLLYGAINLNQQYQNKYNESLKRTQQVELDFRIVDAYKQASDYANILNLELQGDTGLDAIAINHGKTYITFSENPLDFNDALTQYELTDLHTSLNERRERSYRNNLQANQVVAVTGLGLIGLVLLGTAGGIASATKTNELKKEFQKLNPDSEAYAILKNRNTPEESVIETAKKNYLVMPYEIKRKL
ncbi:MAG: hypothetical protein ACMXYK_01190 [Candidatus Woesearchaeota archaeon]